MVPDVRYSRGVNAISSGNGLSSLSGGKTRSDFLSVCERKPCVASCSLGVFGFELCQGRTSIHTKQVGPRSPGCIIRKRVSSNVVLIAQLGKRVAREIVAPKADHVSVSELGSPDTLSFEIVHNPSAARIHVSDIFFGVANSEMMRVHTKPIVAGMKDETTGRDLPLVRLERKPMGKLLRSNASRPKKTIALIVLASLPNPATLGMV